ncbi:hypothetical protein DYB32_005405 [Aphanomyces invadans]|uniref:Crossover junction endonuclease MUS81-like HHH domain-containing protein n=1 Tax=Aphanomyces invadans TaxID=157072 RepID=A0A3R6VKY7_9STRA|nr:hypothetical protein DYB32_005405 [Aphanomyces invadans]
MYNQVVAQAAVTHLLELCKAEGVDVPTDTTTCVIQAGNALNATYREGEYHLQDALTAMRKKFGVVTPEPKRHKKLRNSRSNHKVREGHESDEKHAVSYDTPTPPDQGNGQPNDDVNVDKDGRSTGQKKRENLPATVPKNQPLAKLFTELAGFEYKRGDSQKGTAHMHIAKIIRACDEEITSGQQAMAMKGIGKPSAAKIDEYLSSGMVQELEDFRTGNA